jgi:hypothetical protein
VPPFVVVLLSRDCMRAKRAAYWRALGGGLQSTSVQASVVCCSCLLTGFHRCCELQVIASDIQELGLRDIAQSLVSSARSCCDSVANRVHRKCFQADPYPRAVAGCIQASSHHCAVFGLQMQVFQGLHSSCMEPCPSSASAHECHVSSPLLSLLHLGRP